MNDDEHHDDDRLARFEALARRAAEDRPAPTDVREGVLERVAAARARPRQRVTRLEPGLALAAGLAFVATLPVGLAAWPWLERLADPLLVLLDLSTGATP